MTLPSTTPLRETPRSNATGRLTAGVGGALLLAWSAVSWGIADHDGRYTDPALLGVLAGTVLAVLAVGWPHLLPNRLWPIGLTVAALLIAVSPLVWHPRYYAHGSWFPVSEVLLGLAGVLAGGAALVGLAGWARQSERARSRAHWVFWISLALATAAGAAMVRAAPDPHIDVFYLLQGSAKGLVQGKDMYQQKWAASPQVYHSHGLFAVYPYLPWTSVLLAPFRLVLGDVRYGEIAALAVAAITLRSIAGEQVRRSAVLGLLPLLVALHPKVTYADQQAWTEPLLVALLALMVWAVLRGRSWLAVACLALALASKQHIVLLLPIAAVWPAFGLRRTLTSAGLALLAVSPWIIAGPRDFWHDAVDVNLGYKVLPYALDLPALADRHGHKVGFALTALGLLVGFVLALRLVRRQRSAASFAAGCALIVLALDITNKQSFFNHYTLATGLIVTAVCAGLPTISPLSSSGRDSRPRAETASA
jgi:hypothetical protein